MVTIKSNIDSIRKILQLDSGKTRAITIPKSWIKELKLDKGQYAKVVKGDGFIAIYPLSP
jgi:antitoxin component of MazEF toxin-antitoxin module